MAESEPQFLDANPATGLPTVSAAELRGALDAFVPGVIGAGDLFVSPGTGRVVSVATGTAIVAGSQAGQGRYRCPLEGSAMTSDTFEAGGIPAATNNPRIDQIIARVFDHTFDGSGQRKWRLAVAVGAETAGTTLTSRNGAMSDANLTTSFPNWLRLADIITRPGMGSYATADIADRRTWAGGPVSLVTSVPANAPDGYVTHFLADAQNGVWFPYRKRFASNFASKWEPLVQTDVLYTGLPSAPFDGQTISYLADGTNGIIWRLRYRAASASAYKWEVVGGSALFAEVVTRESTASQTYVALTTAGPSITVPLAGDYDIEVRSRGFNTGAGFSPYMSYDIGATAASDNDAAFGGQAVGNVDLPNINRQRRKTITAVNTALVSKYRVNGGTGFFEARTMLVRPIRVG